MQLKSRLRELHALVGKTIEEFHPNEPAFYDDLAYHYEQAEDVFKALEYLEKAGGVAKATYQNDKAIEFYDKMIFILETILGESNIEAEVS
jgi:hypothetical protein